MNNIYTSIREKVDWQRKKVSYIYALKNQYIKSLLPSVWLLIRRFITSYRDIISFDGYKYSVGRHDLPPAAVRRRRVWWKMKWSCAAALGRHQGTGYCSHPGRRTLSQAQTITDPVTRAAWPVFEFVSSPPMTFCLFCFYVTREQDTHRLSCTFF